MNEDVLIKMVMETRERIEKLEENGFKPADRERLSTIIVALDFLIGSFKRLEDETVQMAANIRTLNDDMAKVKEKVFLLDLDMAKVKTKLEIA